MATAFQVDAFQSDAFQVLGGAAQPLQPSWDDGDERRRRKREREEREALEHLRKVLKQIIEPVQEEAAVELEVKAAPRRAEVRAPKLGYVLPILPSIDPALIARKIQEAIDRTRAERANARRQQEILDEVMRIEDMLAELSERARLRLQKRQREEWLLLFN
ncbi:MAG: hypothetical protein RMK97_01990 [Sutterellaceae bacterium]|nr:hypothetical protein [Burkholderiaceae bacterium]MDW8429265.1 hypothetical protein [Sutterellaceae bacterium]